METAGSRRKKRKRTATLLDPEAVYTQLLESYNTALAASPPEARPLPAVTPLKRRGKDREESPPEWAPEMTTRRRVVFNLKLNQTQHFGQDDIVAGSDLQERMAGATPTKSLLKSPTSTEAPDRKKKRLRRLEA